MSPDHGRDKLAAGMMRQIQPPKDHDRRVEKFPNEPTSFIM